MTSFPGGRPITCKQPHLCEFGGNFGSKAREKNGVWECANLQWLENSRIPNDRVFTGHM